MLTVREMELTLQELDYKEGFEFHLKKDPGEERYYVQVSFKRPDIVTGDIGLGWSGKRYVTKYMARSEFVALAFGTVLALEEHECREMFKYRGRRIFGPHIDVDALWEVARRVDVRE